LNQPFNTGLNQNATNPGAITYTPMALTEIAMPTVPSAPAAPATSTGPASYTHMPDGSWADAQVTLSSAAAIPGAPETPTTTPGSDEELIVAMYQYQMEMDNMMFQQNMMQMQQQAAMAQKAAMAARNKSNIPEVKWVQSPDLKSAISYDDEGGDE
jgi:hypothetical protein